VLSVGNAIGAIGQKGMYIFMGLGCRCDLRIYRSIETKDLKKLLAYSSLAHVGLMQLERYTLTLDGLRGTHK
jgi:NADH-quinone oxidoreductase subunit M